MGSEEIIIREYQPEDRPLVERFRELSFQEGNESLSAAKYNPDASNCKTWLLFIDDQLASLSVCEASHYTGDPKVAVRLCRYHILKAFRHCNAGFRMLPYQVKWAQEAGFKIMYWTQDIRNKSLNALYQHRRIMPGKKNFFIDPGYQEFRLRKDLLFKVSEKSDFLQFIYQRNLDGPFEWQPKTNTIPIVHDGVEVDVEQALKLGAAISYS